MKLRLIAIAACLALVFSVSAFATTDKATLEEGLRGSHVRQVQARLSQLGFYAGEIDGIFGDLTLAAVTAFQQMNGLTNDGVVGVDTAARLYAVDALSAAGIALPEPFEIRVSYGYNGPVVFLIQEHLAELGFYREQVDGKYGSATRQAVRDFQEASGIEADGIVGPDTWEQMFADVVTTQANDAAFTVVPFVALPGVTAPPLPIEPTSVPTEAPIRLDGGETGDHVLYVQQRLMQLGYFTGLADGRYGETTEQAVLAFQAANALQIDGIVGPETWDALQDVNAVVNPALTIQVSPTAAP